VVPHGLPASLLGRPVEEERDGRVGIAQVAIYMEHKGVRYGARALNEVLRRHPGVHVSFLGTRRGRARVLEDFDPALHERIRVVPEFHKEDLPALLSGHQIKLFPSVMEGFSLGLLESMACGLVPVSTTIPSIQSVVEDGVEGLLVPPRDSSALEAALEQLVTDASLRARLRGAANRKAQRYSWKDTAEQTLELYADARKRRDSPSRTAA
jgi:glycosyltransferase involved in cell wall biosynthesis